MRWLFPLLAISWATCALADQPKQNVLFIVADDLRVDLGCYGSVAKTPHLDALAARGVAFTHAYCQQAVCNPSRSSFLTGLRPDTLHHWSNGTHFRAHNTGLITMPEWYKQHGFDTRCVGKIFHNWHTTPKGDRQSWTSDEFLFYANHGEDVAKVTGKLPPNLAVGIGRKYGQVPVTECRDVPDEAYYDGRVAAEAVKTLRAIREKPFFLAVGFWKPHAPFNAPKKYWDLYQRDQLPPVQAVRPIGAPEIAFHDSREILGLPPNHVSPTLEQIAEMRHGYLANVSYMDAQVGKVLQALDDLQLRDNTTVVFLSDHGYHLGEYQLWAKTSCFERDAQVPLIVSSPGLKSPGRQSSDLVELVDLFPTICELTGMPAPKRSDGKSFATTVRNGAKAPKQVAFTQHPRPAYYDRTPAGIPEVMGYSVRTADGRYTEWRNWHTGTLVGVEYYDDTLDPHKPRNLFESKKNQPAVLKARAALHTQFPPEVAPAKR